MLSVSILIHHWWNLSSLFMYTVEPQENNISKTIQLSATTLTLSFSFVSSNLALRFTTWRLMAVRCCFIIKSSVFLTDTFMALKALFVMLRLYHDIQYNSLVLSSLSRSLVWFYLCRSSGRCWSLVGIINELHNWP